MNGVYPLATNNIYRKVHGNPLITYVVYKDDLLVKGGSWSEVSPLGSMKVFMVIQSLEFEI